MEDLKLLVNRIIPILEMYDKQGVKVSFVSGGCPEGGDRFAELLADQFKIPIKIHYPDNTKLPRNPVRKDFAIINFDRNTLIAKDADLMVAVVAADRTGGTEDTIKKFKKFHPQGVVVLI